VPDRLRKIPFTPDLLPSVQGFDCGDAPWEREVADWLKVPAGQGGAVDDLRRGCETWLYATDDGELVGVGSLTASRWNWPSAVDPRVPISLIPFVGVQRRFWGKPEGPPDERYSAQILGHLVFEAIQRRDRYPLVGLFVHPENVRAIRFYEKAGFAPFSKTYQDPTTGVVYRSMLLDLPVE